MLDCQGKLSFWTCHILFWPECHYGRQQIVAAGFGFSLQCICVGLRTLLLRTGAASGWGCFRAGIVPCILDMPGDVESCLCSDPEKGSGWDTGQWWQFHTFSSVHLIPTPAKTVHRMESRKPQMKHSLDLSSQWAEVGRRWTWGMRVIEITC